MTYSTYILLPCPFCGGVASLHNDTDSPCWFVGCSNSACPIEPHHYADTEAEAIATWNRRAPAPSAAVVFDAHGCRDWMYRNLPDGNYIDYATWWANHLTAGAKRFVKVVSQPSPAPSVLEDAAQLLESQHTWITNIAAANLVRAMALKKGG